MNTQALNTQTLKTFFETLNQETTLLAFAEIYARDVYFKDPFNQTHGVPAVYEIFQEMYAKLDAPRFEVLECVAMGQITYVKWRFIFCFKGKSEEQGFEGVSRMQYNDENKISAHIDYWDAAEQVYEKIPLLGSIIRLIKRKIAK